MGPAVATDALLPLELATTDAGAVIVAFGGVQALIATVVVPVAVHALSVTTTLSVTLPETPAVNAMDGVSTAEVIVPPLMDHE